MVSVRHSVAVQWALRGLMKRILLGSFHLYLSIIDWTSSLMSLYSRSQVMYLVGRSVISWLP